MRRYCAVLIPLIVLSFLSIGSSAHGSGQVIAEGANYSSQCDVPADAQTGVTQIAGGEAQSLALKDGIVLAWGGNPWGQCDVPADAQSGVTQVSAGYDHSLALKDGKVIAWGANDYGQCNVPADAQTGVIQIAAGESYSLALKTPPLGIKPGPLTAGGQFTLDLSLTQSITRAFDLYLIADTPNGPYTIFMDGRIVAGIQPLYRNVQGYAAPYSVTIMPGAEIPPSMSGAAVCFYVVTVDKGKIPPVSSLQDLVPRSLYVITFDKAQAVVN